MTSLVKPALKWPGGKFRLLGFLLPQLPPGRRLVEPFVGSGALFLNAPHPTALLSDLNADLIGFYQALADDGAAFIRKCRRLFTDAANNAETYLRHRDTFNARPPGRARAALFLYLNRHGYNGLVRYNARGVFNVPFGRYVKPYFPAAEMRALLARMREGQSVFRQQDFRETFAMLAPGDVVYCDPPYIPLSATANFTGYAGSAFGIAEQRELARLAEEARGRGITVLISNHDTPAARELYAGARQVHTVDVRRNISCVGGKREMVGELLAVYSA